MKKELFKVSYEDETRSVTLSILEGIQKEMTEEDLEEVKSITDIAVKIFRKYI